MSGDLEDRALAVLRPFVQREEQCRLEVYDDGYGNGTVGWGSTFYPSGIRVKMGDPPISQEYADSMLEFALDHVIKAVTALLLRPVGVNQLAAMCDLAYNIGIGAFEQSSVLRDFNDGRVDDAHVSFALWNKARNRATGQLVTVGDLVRRRAREMVLFETPDDTEPAPSPAPQPPPRSLPTQDLLAARYRAILVRLAQWQPLEPDDLATMQNLARSGEG